MPQAAAVKKASPRFPRRDPLTEYGIVVLCRLRQEGVKMKTLSYAFGLGEDVVRRLVRRDTWKIEAADSGMLGVLRKPVRMEVPAPAPTAPPAQVVEG